MLIKKEDVPKLLEELKDKRVVFTNGCFDILTRAHCRYLNEAKNFGDVLIVGMNSDESVKKLKGDGRPVNSQDDRQEVLSTLKPVDYVIIFDELDVVELIDLIKPKIYVKGGDYTIDTINQEERKMAEKVGSDIKIVSKLDGVSTTKVIEKIKN